METVSTVKTIKAELIASYTTGNVIGQRVHKMQLVKQILTGKTKG